MTTLPVQMLSLILIACSWVHITNAYSALPRSRAAYVLTTAKRSHSQLQRASVVALRVTAGDESTFLPTMAEPSAFLEDDDGGEVKVPTNGLISYIGSTVPKDPSVPRWSTAPPLLYKAPSAAQRTSTRFRLWRQLPWKKIKGKAVITLKIGGSIPLEAPSSSGLPFGGPRDLEPVASLTELQRMFLLATYDPRIEGVYVTLSPVSCGYAKLQELRRSMALFRQAGKRIFGFAETASEKDLYLAMGFDRFYMPPEGVLDLRGFSASAQFARGVFDKIGIEPQVQRIGKYKSFGDTFNRTSIAEAQREVVSSLLTEASDFWVDAVAADANLTTSQVRSLWAEKRVLGPEDYDGYGLLSGVKYKDQVDEIVADEFTLPKRRGIFARLLAKFSTPSKKAAMNASAEASEPSPRSSVESSAAFATAAPGDFDSELSRLEDLLNFELQRDFEKYPRRQFGLNATQQAARRPAQVDPFDKKAVQRSRKIAQRVKSQVSVASALPAQRYLRKMRKGDRVLAAVLPVKETTAGVARIAIINAVGGIGSGESTGNNIGSDTLVSLLRRARADAAVKAVVLRIDSPGGSALASDVMWKEIRALSRVKPVVASQVDVAASGGYYLSMACDAIVSEELTVTGSIGVVTSKFNAQELNKRIGLGSETISIGRYAEFFRTDRGFTAEESAYFESTAQKFYDSFVTKAAASRSMSVESMQEVAQGRVWTGRQALQQGLCDHIGGLWKALEVAVNLTESGSVGGSSFGSDSFYSSSGSDSYGSISSSSNTSSSNSNSSSGSKVMRALAVETLRAPRRPPSLLTALTGATTATTAAVAAVGGSYSNRVDNVLAVVDDAVLGTNLASAESFGISPLLAKSPLLAALLQSSGASAAVNQLLLTATTAVTSSRSDGTVTSVLLNRVQQSLLLLEDFVDELL